MKEQYKQFLKLFKNTRKYYVGLLLASFFLTIFSVKASEKLGNLTARLSEQDYQNIIILFAGVIGIYLFQEISRTLYKYICGKIEGHIYQIFQTEILKKVLYLPVEQIYAQKKSNIYTLVTRDIEEYTVFLSDTVPNILFQIIRLVFSVTYIFTVNWEITSCYLITTCISIIIQIYISKSIKKTSNLIKTREIELNERIQSSLQCQELVKVYNCEQWMEELRNESETKYMKANLEMSVRTMPLQIAGIICGIFPILCISLMGLYMSINDGIAFEQFIIIFYICQGILPEQLHYVDLWMEVMKIIPSQKRLLTFLDTTIAKQEICETENKGIILKHIKYKYPNMKEWVISDVSIKIAPGKKVAFIGKSGGGKSTLLKIISGLLKPQEGTVEVSEFAYESQYPFLFTDSILQNILYSHECNDPEFQKACKTSELLSILTQLDNGIETMLGENGKSLSGGQCQRIALARTLNSRKSIMLFDETFSALDVNIAKKIVENMMAGYHDTTMIFCLHQKELLPYMDEIYVIENGKIMEQGSYEKLCKSTKLL